MRLTAAFMPPAEMKTALLQKTLKAVLVRGERIHQSFPLPMHTLIFTDKRLLILEAEGDGTQIPSCKSIPFRSITRFQLAPNHDAEGVSQLSLWLSGSETPLCWDLETRHDADELHRTLADAVLNKYSSWLIRQMQLDKQAKTGTIRALGFTGAAMLGVLWYRKKHPRKASVASAPLSAPALKALIRSAIKR